ncbi:hypothetical protein LUD75_02855 [Epilithonimonas sp. JDS]|uniref:hypothetical protein n=1 Tax=Epilithonimonas sp. JDS TaxID=2902797 RepID=UPI001E2A5861|nr:hypothetical protein [Epilithonimonas sp. JDS]MCD9853624.1 hypothetical protein [Epilithonimonas sp. JDS]
MKKILLGIALSVVVLQGCKKDDDDDVVDETVVLTVDEQNAYDDAAAIEYMETHYFDTKGNVVAFDSTITTDDNFPKLSSYNPVKLPSGVIYILRPGTAQPDPGTAVNPTDVINIMQVTKMYVSAKVNDKIVFGSEGTFANTVSGDGIPVKDPGYFYVKKSVLDKFNKDNNTTFDRSFFEIEGLQEGLKYFKAFNLDDSADYNMQGVIIVPSRAGFARDTNYYSLINRSFVFNFQLYKTKTRNLETEN